MFTANSWQKLPNWSYLMAYHTDHQFKVLVNRARLPQGVKRLHNWSEYDTVAEKLHKTQLPVEEVPRYVTLARKFKKTSTLKDLDQGLLQKIPYWDTLYEHQKQAVVYGVHTYRGRVYLADEMGVGKSFSAITILNYLLMRKGGFCKALIVCPASLEKNWKNISKEKQVFEGDIHVFSYDKAKNLSKELKKQKYDLYLADEAHCLKNPKTKRYKKLAPVLKRIEFRILLSGTPTVNRSDELYSPLSLMYPKLFKNFRKYTDRYYNTISRKCRLPAELSLILPLFGFVRRLKTQVLKLPEKVVQVHPIRIKEASKGMQEMMQKMLLDENKNNPNYLKYLIGEAFHLLGEIKSKSKIFENTIQSLLSDTAVKGPHKVVFCYHRSVIASVKRICDSLGRTYDVISGETPKKKRQEIVDKYQRGELQVAILSINAAAVGITLTKSHHCIMAEQTWVPGIQQQCHDRVHRIGQNHKVFIDNVVCLSSIDDFITRCGDGKKKIHKLLLQKAKEQIKKV